VQDVHDAAAAETTVGVTETSTDFDDFFRAEQPKMVALAIALTGVPEVARDLAQDALVKAYRAWPSVRAMDKPGAWLRRITINGALSWHRSHGRETAARARMRPEPTSVLPDAESDRFWTAVRSLPERQRAAIALHYLEDMSVVDVATALEVTSGTVKASLFAARATLAAALGVGSTNDPLTSDRRDE
jgi:RNA polymerase sigma-70 factor (ECF subfamily)